MKLTDLAESVVMSGTAKHGFDVVVDGVSLGRVRRLDGASWVVELATPCPQLLASTMMEALATMLRVANSQCARLAFRPT